MVPEPLKDIFQITAHFSRKWHHIFQTIRCTYILRWERKKNGVPLDNMRHADFRLCCP